MNITKTENKGIVTLKLEGWLDTLSATELGETVAAIETAASIVLDFDAVEYMSSAGLRQVIFAHKTAKELGAAFSVINVNQEVMSIFRMTNIDKKIKISAK
ncbi:MAG: STAS domain-containing protein [Clostridia bacterium]|nr:STAS domain-containing protein [Clostridia bacterium]